MTLAETKIRDAEVHRLFHSRWSPKEFLDSPIPREDLISIFEAARVAPSSFNEQPWRFIATEKGGVGYEKMLDCLSPNNLKWAKNAPVLVLSIAKLQFERNAKPNRHAFHDVGMSVSNLVMQAMSLGIYARQMAGFDEVKARESFSLPDGFEPVAVIALGFIDMDTDESNNGATSRRLNLEDILFEQSFGVKSGIVS